jgi:hypothetical protein
MSFGEVCDQSVDIFLRSKVITESLSSVQELGPGWHLRVGPVHVPEYSPTAPRALLL